ncbi:YncE family protein [Mangrovivirga cuniculi]|uniref:Cell surface protein n=1 Tax=Mangrovivirga cuniculi TaxID=2715131 RepID=A0A4D7JE72_9BACT|nr:DUF5074 domain-containing protein [Mangrovivirga cuniculi]QCK13971.1 hypothetical protein DCC35_03985 [Mangrovivirga cuniculi]
MKQLKFLFIALGIALTVACDNEDPQPSVSGKGILILNEGSFGNGNASLSYYSFSDASVTNNVFYNTNNFDLGDQAQGITTYDGEVFITVQNSGKIEVINSTDFTSISTVDSRLISPRYTYAGPEGIFVTDWNDGYNGWLKEIDPSSYEVIDSVETGAGPNEPAIVNGKIWVPNGGGFTTDSTVSIFNADLSLDKEIETGINPSFIVEDNAGNVWVVCKGKSWPADDTRRTSVYKFDSNGNFQEEILGPEGQYFNSVSYNSAEGLIYLGSSSGVHTLGQEKTSITQSFIDVQGVYGLEYDEINGLIMVGVSTGFTTDGEVHIFNEDGTFVKKETVGIGPNGFSYAQK